MTKRQQRKKPSGLIVRERELAAARRELANIRSTGVATKRQTKHAQAAIKLAESALRRQQQEAARRAKKRT